MTEPPNSAVAPPDLSLRGPEVRVVWYAAKQVRASGLRLGALRRGLQLMARQSDEYARTWEVRNSAVHQDEGPLWVVLGDSAAQGVGASHVDGGYVGQLRTLLEARDQTPWRVVNLSRSGGRARDVVGSQIPALADLPVPSLVTCAIGANDLIRGSAAAVEEGLRQVIDQLPPRAVVATLPQGLGRRRTTRVNRLIRECAAANEVLVADLWAHTGPPWAGNYAEDFFHPSASGYANWTRAFAEAVDVDPDRMDAR
jgi:acyl-CoA thioesterase I